jgi:hypothetical protein
VAALWGVVAALVLLVAGLVRWAVGLAGRLELTERQQRAERAEHEAAEADAAEAEREAIREATADRLERPPSPAEVRATLERIRGRPR